MRPISISNPDGPAAVDEHITAGLDGGCRREMAGMAGADIAEAGDGGHLNVLLFYNCSVSQSHCNFPNLNFIYFLISMYYAIIYFGTYEL